MIRPKGTKAKMEELGRRVLAAVKTQLYLDMPYLEHALGNLSEILDLSTRTIGTDGHFVCFHSQYVFETYMTRPGLLNRTYMHILLHNLLLHPFHDSIHTSEEKELWDLACDIAVESVVDSMDVPALRMVTRDFRREWYEKLQQQIRTLSAEQIFRFLTDHPPDSKNMLRLEKEFVLDDHVFWERIRDKTDEKDDSIPEDIHMTPMTQLPLKEVWEKAAKAVEIEVERSGSSHTRDSGRLTWSLQLRHAKRRDYRLLLQKFMRRKEVARVDPESFDPAYYWYGMMRYQNMPLLEELEGREVEQIDTIVIAIDTSASTRRHHVAKFLSETVNILRQREYFFDRVHIHIIECDDRIQKDIRITAVDQIERYAGTFEVSGGYGTDYRPVFSYIKELSNSCNGL